MARIAGVNIPENKHVEISLTHIFGIGRKTAQNICTELKIDYTRKISDLSEEEIESLRSAIGSIVVEGDLRRNISTNIKRLMDLGSYRGIDTEGSCLQEVKILKIMQEQEKALKSQ